MSAYVGGPVSVCMTRLNVIETDDRQRQRHTRLSHRSILCRHRRISQQEKACLSINH